MLKDSSIETTLFILFLAFAITAFVIWYWIRMTRRIIGSPSGIYIIPPNISFYTKKQARMKNENFHSKVSSNKIYPSTQQYNQVKLEIGIGQVADV